MATVRQEIGNVVSSAASLAPAAADQFVRPIIVESARDIVGSTLGVATAVAYSAWDVRRVWRNLQSERQRDKHFENGRIARVAGARGLRYGLLIGSAFLGPVPLAVTSLAIVTADTTKRVVDVVGARRSARVARHG